MNFENFYNPKRIAVVGASREETKVGHIIFKNLLKSGKEVYPVNPNAESILNVPCKASLSSIKEKIDLVIICVKSQLIPDIIEEMKKKKIKSAIIISSGFSEVGNKDLEKEVYNKIKKYNIRIIGPNCLGLINPYSKLNASFFDDTPKEGNIALISQSGALGVAMLDMIIEKGIGLSKFISIGNAIDMSFDEIISSLNRDDKTKIITLYMESLKDGKKFMQAVSKAKKPVVVLKAGKSESGKKAASSHTAALAIEDKIYDGAFKQCGVVRVETLRELFNISKMAELKLKGNKCLIITNAGGPGVMASDCFEKNGLMLIKIKDKLINELNGVLPLGWSKNNPIDIIGDATPDRYETTLKIVSKYKKDFDFIFLILTPQAMTYPEKVAEVITKFKDIKIITCFMGGNKVKEAKKILENNKNINFEEPEDAAIIIKKAIAMK